MSAPLLEVKVWGDYACWTRPDQKVERFSYLVPTPTGIRGVLDAIFFKPEMTWIIREIHVLSEISTFSILRNEVKNVAPSRRPSRPLYIEDDRTQRYTVGLRNVAYIVKAEARVKLGVDALPIKYVEQARRRVKRGQCAWIPYLGCREFSAHFGEPEPDDRPIDVSMLLGRMLHSLDYDSNGSGRASPRFFEARMVHGIVRIPTLEELGHGA